MSESNKTKRSADSSAKKNIATAELKSLKTAADKKKGEVKKVDAKKNNQISSGADKLLWLLSFILIIAAIGGNYYYSRYLLIDESSLVRLGRVAAVIATIAIGLGILLFTNRGRKLTSFARESYIELRKVIWPTRQEAMQTTFIVFIAVCVVSLFLYLADLIFLQIVRVITL